MSSDPAGPAPGPTSDAVRDRLRSIVDPCSAAIGTDLDIVEMGLVEEVTVDGGAVTVSMRLTSPGCLMVEYFAREVDDVVGSMSGVASVTLETDAGFEWHRGMMEDAAKETRETRRRELADRYADALGVASTAAGVGTTPPDEEAAGGGGERERTK